MKRMMCLGGLLIAAAAGVMAQDNYIDSTSIECDDPFGAFQCGTQATGWANNSTWWSTASGVCQDDQNYYFWYPDAAGYVPNSARCFTNAYFRGGYWLSSTDPYWIDGVQARVDVYWGYGVDQQDCYYDDMSYSSGDCTGQG
jgi:hypothetical protein